jgi:hypothetical protein
MKRMAGMVCAVAGLLVGAARAETVSLVQTTDMRGQSEYSILSREEYAALQKELLEEAKVYPAAAAEAKKEWDADKANKLPFQGNRVKPRSAKKVGADFPDREKAEKRKTLLEERASEKQSEEADKSKKNKVSEEDEAKEAARAKAFDDAFSAIAKKMGDKLGHPVPQVGIAFEPKK